MKNYHLVDVRYYGATNNLGSRIRLKSDRLKETVWLNYDYSQNSIADMAKDYLSGHPIIGMCETKDGYGVIIDSVEGMFLSIKK